MGSRVLALVCVVAGCGNNGGGGDDDDVPGDGPPIDPPITCSVPPEGMLVDTSSAAVVGNGTAASCTQQALQAAVDLGGAIRFDCGAAPATIALTQPIKINNVAGTDGLGDTVIDGGGTVTLSGGNVTRIIDLNACEPPFNSPMCNSFPHPHLTVQRLAFIDANDGGTDGGGAIFRHGGALTVIDSSFTNNTCATTGQDTAGGAIRLEQRTPALIVGSTFQNNRCSNGGAIGMLQAAPIRIINSVISGNTATGNGGNPGNGGNGAGIYYDGVDLDLEICGVNITNNTGNAFGGGIFLVDNAGRGTVSITNAEIADNVIPTGAGKPSHGGATYLQGADVTLANVSAYNNAAGFAAGLYINAMNGMGSLNATNLTVANTMGDGLRLEGGIGGTLLNATIAGNMRGIAGAANLTLTNTIIANNTSSNCGEPAMTAATSFQFPDAACGSGITVIDTELGTLGRHDGAMIQTFAPASTSPARGAGISCPAVDARGKPRPPTGCTAGAHE